MYSIVGNIGRVKLWQKANLGIVVNLNLVGFKWHISATPINMGPPIKNNIYC